MRTLASRRRRVPAQARHSAADRVRAVASALVLVTVGCSSTEGSEPNSETPPSSKPTVVASRVLARFPAEEATALAVGEAGRLLVGERLSGRVSSVDPASGTVEKLFTVEDLDADLEQGGLLDLAVDTEGTVLASYTAGDGHLVIDEVDASSERFTRRWDGPRSAERANGGRMAVLGGDTAAQDTLVIGVGDLLEPDQSSRPDTANGKVLVINDAGEASPFATGLNNPFALGNDGKNTVWVADNSPGADPERLLRLTAARSEEVASWTDTRVPSGLAVLDDGTLAICYYATGDLVLVDADDPRGGTGPLVADDCRYEVQYLGDRRLAYSTEDEVVVVQLDG